MSRIGKKPVSVPAGVKVQVKAQEVQVQGPLGTLKMTYPTHIHVAVNEAEKSVVCELPEAAAENRQARADWGTTRAKINNMIIGVTKGYEKSLEVVGVGWAPTLQGKQLKLVVGYANPIMMPIPDGLKVALDEKNKQIVKVSGPDKQMVGEFAASMRAKRKPEPYNGKGIKYTTETIKKKQGKQFGA
jgi:large subunit ribosomal protein L6